MSRKGFVLLLLLTAVCAVQAQTYNQIDESGNISQRDENGTFNPNRRDSTKVHKEIPRGVKAWTVDRHFGDVMPTELDTMPHLYQNSVYATGPYGQYNTLGNNYTPRQNRIFIDRRPSSDFFFTDALDYTTVEPDQFLFLNTLSPYTNISYDNCGDKQNGEDHIDAKFAVNANKQLGFGFDLDYHYATGYYQNQNNAQFRASLFSSYRGDRYQMHLLASFYHRKHSENGGITNDNYIVHPELESQDYSENEIPTLLEENWNRNNSQHLFLSHRYNIGFYRKVPMTPEEIKARQFAAASAKQKEEQEKKDKDEPKSTKGKPQQAAPTGRPADAKIMGDEPEKKPLDMAADTTRIKVASKETMDSLLAVKARQDSIDATMKKEYVPVTSIIHPLDISNHEHIYQAYQTPSDYYAKTYYDLNDELAFSGDSIFDKTKYLSVKNTVALAMLEGFNKYAKAGLKAFVSYEYRRFQMPDLLQTDSSSYYLNKWTGHCLNIGGQLSKTQGKTLHFNLLAELGVTGMDAGALSVDFHTDLNFPLFGDTIQLAANAYFHRRVPHFLQEQYHSKHLWWDQSLDSETRTHVEGLFTYQKTDTRLRIAIDEIQNYTYFGTSYTTATTGTTRQALTAGVFQESGNINVLTAQLMQNVRWGILNWENIITYQNSSNADVLPLPALNVFTNLYLKFRIARVLLVELGGSCTFFTKYDAPDYVPQLQQFAIQQNSDSRVTLGGYPFVDVYANMHLKRARFFVAMTHVNAGSGSRMQFFTPHYPTDNRVLHVGVSWNFYN